MEPQAAWWSPLKRLNDEYFAGPSSGVSWADYVQRLNSKHGLDGRDALSTLPKPDLPPTWFIGDVTTVRPGQWVLVFSLNPKLDKDTEWYVERQWDAEKFWEFQTQWLRNWWNRSFHGPSARLASLVLRGLDSADERAFAPDNMVFVELCPYASDRFGLGSQTLADLAENDVACRVEDDMVYTMLQDGEPALVLVNGNRAIEGFEVVHRVGLDWQERQYPSATRPGRRLWHRQGVLHVRGRMIPIAGFPFLRKPRTHNSSAEIEQLATQIRRLLPSD